jgi:hypothetical protein
MVSNAVVSVQTQDNTFLFHEDTIQKGCYYSDEKFIGVIDRTYYLSVDYDNKNIHATATMIPVYQIDSVLLYTINPETNLFSINYVAQQVNINENAMYEIFLDWSFIAPYDTLSIPESTAKLYYYTLKTVDVNEFFAPLQQDIFFPKGTKIIERKYSLTKQHAEFIRGMLFETQWTGGFFDAAEGNVYTNLSVGGLGFFGACTIIEHQIFVE